MYAVIGANGFLGNYIIKAILSQTNDKILAVDVNCPETEEKNRIAWRRCNILNDAEFDRTVDHLQSSSDVKIIFLAAYHHPDLVAKNPKLAWDINVTALSKCINKFHYGLCCCFVSPVNVYWI